MSNLIAISPKADRNVIRSLAVLIVVVIPGLGTADRNGFRSIGVSDDETIRGRSSNLAGVTSRKRRYLPNGVGDVTASLLYVQIRPGVRPVVGFAQCDRVTRCDFIRIELHFDARGPLAILVVAIVPGLGHRNAGLGYGFITNIYNIPNIINVITSIRIAII